MKIFKSFGFFKNTNRRSVTNVIVDRNAQLRFLLPFLILYLTGVGVILILGFTVSNSLNQLSADVISASPKAAEDIQSTIQNVQWIGSFGMFLIAVLSLMFWLLYSHRIFGAVYAIEKQIKNFQDGNYNETLKLRKHDEFFNTAKALNELAEKLRLKK
jgi:methyl-accepting chemotaxis protein